MSRPIYTFVRHCNISNNSKDKTRPDWFTKEKALINLLETKDANTHVTIMLDTASVADPLQHFSNKYKRDVQVVCKHGGTDAHSFINLVEYFVGLNLPDDAIVYLLEDDFVHLPGWAPVMREAFDANLADYVTLYDHSDKYTFPMYSDLKSKIHVTKSCHWRSTPSTTNTYALLFKKLVDTAAIHLRFSDKEIGFTFDHNKFLHLAERGDKLISSIPGFSTHVEQEFLSPIVDWRKILMTKSSRIL